MSDPIDIERFLAELADEDLVAAELQTLTDDELQTLTNDEGIAVREARERTIDALIQAVAGTPAAAIRETLNTVLAQSLAAENKATYALELDEVTRQLREYDDAQPRPTDDIDGLGFDEIVQRLRDLDRDQ
ncbi:hypothetical protein [Amycolatopsis sp. NPDC051716]|uniref:hypothetical protein n=1 Tax=Amycolatopsis sp. NPDC051716 TaxID=3155804 RepID=UPI00344A5E2D